MEGLLFVPPVLTLGVTQGSAAVLHTVTPVCLQQHSRLGVVCKHRSEDGGDGSGCCGHSFGVCSSVCAPPGSEGLCSELAR